jgi:PST family polysaccharide transporter/lipopolysaccharide exporter
MTKTNMPQVRKAGSALFWRGLSLSIEKVIFLIRILILARLVAPAEFGLVAIGMLSLALINSVTDFGIVPALVQQPAGDKRYLDTAWTMGLLRGAVVNAAILVLAPVIAAAFDQPDATNIIRMLALASLLQSASSIGIATLTRELKFQRLVLIRLSAAVSNTVISIMLADALGAWAIVWGAVAGAGTYLTVSYIVAPYKPRFRLQRHITATLMKFGRWIFAIGVIAAVTDAAVRWIITERLGVVELGLYFMAVRLAYLPHQLITELVSEVAFPMYAQVQSNAAKAAHAFRSVLINTFALLLPVSAIFLVLIPLLIAEVLGEKWAGASTVMQLLVLVSIVGTLGDTIGPLLKGMGRPKRIAMLKLVQILVLCPIAWVLVGQYGLAGAGLALLIAVVFTQAFAIRYVTEMIEQPFSGTRGSLLAICGATLAGSGISLLIIEALSGMSALIAAGLIGPATIVLTAIYLDRIFKLGLLRRVAEPYPALARVFGKLLD